MQDDILCPTSMSVEIDEAGTHALLSFKAGDTVLARVIFEIGTLLHIGESIPQMVTDAAGERSLGKRSALSQYLKEPDKQIGAHVVKTFLLTGTEGGLRAVDIATEGGQLIRLLIPPEMSTSLSAALAPGGDAVPSGIRPS